uniref:ATP-binding protein n=1 Tax=Lunatibacter salilacus TaxID=2483804 RepID=UPI00374423BC
MKHWQEFMMHELKLACEKNRLGELRSFLSDILKPKDLNEIVQNQLILAVEEVCANLIIHSHNCNPDDFIKLRVTDDAHKITFEIFDSGQAFNILEYEAPDLSKVIKEKRKGGIGILLVKKIMDKIEFESKNSQNVCRLVKQLKSK